MRNSGFVVGVVVCALVAVSASAESSGASAAAPLVAKVALRQLSADPFTNRTSQHHTEVEPDSFAFGSTIVTAFQVGRFVDGGSSGIGWARSINGGKGWTSGILPALTKFSGGGATFDRASDPSVAYDARHHVWLVSALAISGAGGVHAPAILVSRSVDGGATWRNPRTAVTGSTFDKNWTVCDNSSTSPYYGNCYTEYDDTEYNDALGIATSSDGGLTWHAVEVRTPVIGGQPVVQPNGTLIVPAHNNLASVARIIALTSHDGGASFTPPVVIRALAPHEVFGDLRAEPLPSAEIDAAGKVYLVWADCLRSSCTGQDLVMSTSKDGTTWTAPKAIPIDPPSSKVDHFIPGLAVDNETHGATAHLALTYYFYPDATCIPQCRLDVGFVTSSNGGLTWAPRIQLAGPMSLSSLPHTTGGRMVGDYISTSFVNHHPKPVFAVAKPRNKRGALNEAIYTTQ